MSTSQLSQAMGIHGFNYLKQTFEKGVIYYHITRKSKTFRCRKCKGSRVKATPHKQRDIHTGKLASKKLKLRVRLHRIYCRDCEISMSETLEFLPWPKARVTKSLAKEIVLLCNNMAIIKVAQYFGLNWRVVKDIDKDHLEKKIGKPPKPSLKGVKAVTIDELHIGAKKGYKTIVRCAHTGRVLHVEDGRGGYALDEFGKRIKRRKKNPGLDFIVMDMAAGFAKWARDTFPEANIVIDHFHVVKLMNSRVDDIRRRNIREINDIAASVEDEAFKQLAKAEAGALKGMRHVLLYGEEKLSKSQLERREFAGEMYQEVGAAVILRDSLRHIYRRAEGNVQARTMLINWCRDCIESGVKELISIAKTVTRFLDSIVAYWTSGGMSNGAHEGFNNKVRKLNSRAYGYQDDEYFVLKIFDLPLVKEYAYLL